MKSKTIQEAACRCRAAWKSAPNATMAWCCHHRQRFEKLTEPAENRIKFILRKKPLDEQIVRLDNFRPVKKSILTPALAKRVKKYEKLRSHIIKQQQTLQGKLDDMGEKIYDINNQVKKLKQINCFRDITNAEVEKFHKQDVPDHSWDTNSSYGGRLMGVW